MEFFYCDCNILSGFWLFSAYAGDVLGRKENHVKQDDYRCIEGVRRCDSHTPIYVYRYDSESVIIGHLLALKSIDCKKSSNFAHVLN